MISGYGATTLDKKGAFFNTLQEFHMYWDRIDIICPKIKDSQILERADFGFKSPFNNVFIHPSSWPLFFQPFWIYKRGLEIFRKVRFRVVVVHDYPPFYNGLGTLFLNLKIKIPYISEIFHIVGYPKSSNFKESLYKLTTFLFFPFISKRASFIRVMNRVQVPEFLRRAGIKDSRIRNIPAIYLDKDIFKDLKLDKVYDLIFVGRLAENKGLGMLLEIIKKSNFKVIIVGDGPMRDKLEVTLADFSIKDRVKLFGWAKDAQDVARLINQSKILIMSSFNEGGPRVVVEAMACGVPVLASPVGIVPDLIEEGYPIALETWQTSELKDKIDQLLDDPVLYSNAVLKGKELAEKYDKKLAIKYYSDQIQSLIDHE